MEVGAPRSDISAPDTWKMGFWSFWKEIVCV